MSIKFKKTQKYISYRCFDHFYLCDKNYFNDSMQQLLEKPDSFCEDDKLKEDASFTTTVAKVKIAGRTLVIKRFNIKNLKHQIKRSFQPSRAARCFYSANLLTSLQIRTPKPVAFIEKRWGPLRKQAYYISEYIEGPDAFSVFRDAPDDVNLTLERARLMFVLLAQLKQHALYHGDLKASNIIYHDDLPYLIDLDSMRKYRCPLKARQQIAKDKKRFLENWRGTDAMVFFINNFDA